LYFIRDLSCNINLTTIRPTLFNKNSNLKEVYAFGVSQTYLNSVCSLILSNLEGTNVPKRSRDELRRFLHLQLEGKVCNLYDLNDLFSDAEKAGIKSKVGEGKWQKDLLSSGMEVEEYLEEKWIKDKVRKMHSVEATPQDILHVRVEILMLICDGVLSSPKHVYLCLEKFILSYPKEFLYALKHFPGYLQKGSLREFCIELLQSKGANLPEFLEACSLLRNLAPLYSSQMGRPSSVDDSKDTILISYGSSTSGDEKL
jgi:hypothetical protein